MHSLAIALHSFSSMESKGLAMTREPDPQEALDAIASARKAVPGEMKKGGLSRLRL